MDWLSAVWPVIQLGGLAAVVAILLIVIRLISSGALVPGTTHREMREAYQQQLAAEREICLREKQQLAQDRDWYRDHLMEALQLGEIIIASNGNDDGG